MDNKIYFRTPEGGLIAKEFAADSQLGLLRVADPVATSLVQGFSNSALVGDELFPSVRMAKETGRFPAFGKEAFIIPGNLKRAVGEKVQRVQTQSGYVTMSLSEYALGVSLENRERNEWAGNPEMLLNGKLNTIMSKITLYREKLQSVLATTHTNYASGNYYSGASLKWDTDGDPIKDMDTAIDTVTSKIGQRPNKIWFTPTAFRLFKNNAKVLERLKYTGTILSPAQVTPQMVAALFMVEKCLIAYATNGTGSDGGVKKTAPTMAFLWEAVNSACAGVAYVGTGGGIEPSFGYTYELMNSPVVESYYENQTKSQVWDFEHFFDPAITLNEAGYLYYSIA